MSRRLVVSLVIFFLCLMIPLSALAANDIVRTGDVIVPEGDNIFGDIVSLQGNVEVYGQVYGNVVALLGQVIVHSGGAVHGDVVALAGSIDLRPGGSIGGEQVSLGGMNFGGFRLPGLGGLFAFSVGRAIFNVTVRVLLAVLVGAVFPIALNRVRVKLEKHPGPSLGAGLLTWLAALPLALIVAFTIIGIPLSLLLLIALWAASQMGIAAIALLAGQRILPNTNNSLALIALGALLMGLLAIIPFVGLLVRMLLGIVGVGATALTRFGTQDGL